MDSTLQEDDRRILASLIGRRIILIESEAPDASMQVWGNLLLETDGIRLEITDYEEPMEYFGGVEDISRFRLNPVPDNREFHTFAENVPTVRTPLQGTVTGIELVNDLTELPNVPYRLAETVAIRIRTDRQVITFARDWIFSDSITIGIGYEPADDVIPDVESAEDSWKDDDPEVKVTRTVIHLA